MTTQTDKVDALFTQWDRADSPGCAVAIIQDGRVLFARGYGMADLERQIPITPQTVFHMTSTSKQFTAMCVALLAQQGALALDDSVRLYIPELPEYAERIAIRHLLHHTSGLRELHTLLIYAGKRTALDGSTVEDAAALEMLARQQGLNFPPGEQYQYNDSNYFLLGQIVQRISGKSLAAFAKEQIFTPLEMHRSHFDDPAQSADEQRAAGYWSDDRGHYHRAPDGVGLLGAGGIYSTVEDLARWDQNFYRPRVGGAGLIEQILTPGSLRSGRPIHYAFGLFVQNYNGFAVVSHAGTWSGIRSQIIRFPQQQFSVICLCNLSTINPSRLAFQIAELSIEGFAARPVSSSALTDRSAELGCFTGSFREVSAGHTCDVALRDEQLFVHLYQPNTSFPITPIGPAEFQVLDALDLTTVTFERRANGAPLRMHLVLEGEEAATFEAYAPAQPTVEQLDAYAGTYYSEELLVTFAFTRSGDRLVSFGSAPFEPTIEDGFRGPYGMHAEFFRDERGQVAGFRLYADHAGGMRFERVSRG